MRNLSSLTRDQAHAPAFEARSLKHWTAGEVPRHVCLINCLTSFLKEATHKQMTEKKVSAKLFIVGNTGG